MRYNKILLRRREMLMGLLLLTSMWCGSMHIVETSPVLPSSSDRSGPRQAQTRDREANVLQSEFYHHLTWIVPALHLVDVGGCFRYVVFGLQGVTPPCFLGCHREFKTVWGLHCKDQTTNDCLIQHTLFWYKRCLHSSFAYIKNVN